MTITIRAATPDDIDGLFHVRTSVRENTLTCEELEEMGITRAAVTAMIQNSSCAWVAAEDQQVVGFSMIIPEDACLFAAFVLPEYENRGIGKRLVQVAEDELFRQHDVIWLETGKTTRAAGFYRHSGWGNETPADEGDIRLEKRRA
ncbi:GNAT family N-acetyltransferase [Erwinia sp. S43]|uniref:GNAT family N-acetyltransferase n=1 Tax=Erwinia sp. S43 TaxID=2769339 RepID=UPI00190DDB05|nr:GNAT family N-acetyltransferase [Erwinia sp. S43]MBK0031358.1 GNAT family N-acetyltransferase [Erwinia sp. S43]